MNPPVNLDEDIFIPHELIQTKAIRPHIFDIVQCFYFKTPLETYIWKKLEPLQYSLKREFSPEEIKAHLKKKQCQIIDDGLSKNISSCTWCKGDSYILHKHHFPIPSRLGGEKTVSICGSCHAEFHFLESFYEFTNKFTNLFRRNSDV